MKVIKKHKKKFIALGIVLILVIVFVVKSLLSGSNSYDDPGSDLGVSLMTLTRQDLSESITLNGSVQGENTTTYSSTAACEVQTVNVRVGDYVNAGDVLAVLDPELIQEQITSIERNLSNAASLQNSQNSMNQHALQTAQNDRTNQMAAATDRVNLAQSNVDTAQSAYDALNAQVTQKNSELTELRTQLSSISATEENASQRASIQAQIDQVNTELNGEGGLVSQKNAAYQELQSANSALIDARADYNNTQSTTDQAVYEAQQTINNQGLSSSDDTETRTQLSELRAQLNDCTITATSSGIVTSVNAVEGSVNTPNSPMIIVENEGDMIFTASVSETDILKLQEGMRATITSNVLGDAEIGGEVIRVIRVAGGGSGEGTGSGGFSVQIRVNPCELLSGMTAKARIILTDRSDLLCVPYDVVRYDGDQAYVLIAEQNNDGSYTAIRKNIEVGEEMDYYMEVLGGDLEEGVLLIMDYMVEEGDTFETTNVSYGDYGVSDDAYSDDGVMEEAIEG